MLYLEDYLEMIEHLPREFRDRFFELRELDLQVQNTTDQLEKRAQEFFAKAGNLNQSERDKRFQEVQKEYYKTLEDADEKVQMASQMYDLVDRYLRRLDTELHKFKLELEADNPGITETLEQRSLELDQPSEQDSKENRGVRNEKRSASDKKESWGTGDVSYSLGHIGAGGNAIMAAASQAIAATQQMQQGRKSASLKASYEAVSSGLNVGDLSIGKELVTPGSLSLVGPDQTPEKKKSKGSRKSTVQVQPITPLPEPSPPSLLEDSLMESLENTDWTYDPNEPRYCLCNQVSYGDMVACDNEDCPYEWFHYPCVNITQPPKGKWYCPQCTTTMKRRGSRKTPVK